MPVARGRVKRETTVAGGLPTPTDSFTLASPSPPKRDNSIDLTKIDGDGDFTSSMNYPQMSGHSQAETMATNGSQADGLRVVGHDVNRLVNLIDKLRRIGLKSIDGALPELVLVGDQSAGKSSLMGAIAEINLPKKASMCTRCPYNIKTSPSSDWECVVSLQEDHSYEPSARRAQAPKWHLREGMTTRLFKTIYNKSELEEVLTWAQIAVLNPSKDLECFVPGTRNFIADESIEAQYSPNVVAVEIRGPGLPALSFYDLPGLFQHAPTNDLQFLVKAFDELTVKYIKHESAIIICTLTMAGDAAHSKTKELIGRHKAEHKCVGVLTMPDRMQGEASQHEDFDAIFRGTQYVLPRGYYVTKQPGPDCKLDRTADDFHTMAREEETGYFDASAHWGPGGHWSEFRDRCGTGIIQKYLSKEFARQILRSLPDLTAKIEEQTRQVDDDLANLPETPNSKVQYIVRKRLSDFSNDVSLILKGDHANTSLHSSWEVLCTQFSRALEIMRPGCVLIHPKDTSRHPKVITIEDSDNESVIQMSGGRRRQRDDDVVEGRDFKRPRLDLDDTPVPVSFSTPSRPRMKTENGTPQPFASPSTLQSRERGLGAFDQPYLGHGSRAMTLAGIEETIREKSRTGRPEFVRHDVHDQYVLRAIHYWHAPLETFLVETFSLLRDYILRTLHKVMQQYQHTELYRQSMDRMKDFLRTLEAEQKEISYAFYTTESRNLFTINLESFDRYKAEAHRMLKSNRREQRVKGYMELHYRKKPSHDPDKDRQDREVFKSKITDDQLGPDPFEREIGVAAYVRGYYTTARHRFTDSVCANMNSRYFYLVAEKIQYFLETEFGLDEGDSELKCQILLEGSPEVSEKRAYLRRRKEQLLQFSKTLDELKNDTFADEDARGVFSGDDASSVTTVIDREPAGTGSRSFASSRLG